MRRIIGPVVLALLLAAGCSDTEEPEKVGEAGQGEEPADDQPAEEEEKKTTFAVGDVVALGDYEVTVHGVQNPLPPASEFITAPAANKYVGLDIEVKNTTDESKAFSAFLAIELQDAENRTYDLTFTDHQPAVPDGELAAGAGRRGLAVFQVPEAATGLRLLFSGDVFSTGNATVELG